MRIAAKVRLEKEAHPARFCPDKRCLWRIRRADDWKVLSPCPKHPVAVGVSEARVSP